MKRVLLLTCIIFLPVVASADECIKNWVFSFGSDDVFRMDQCVRSSGGSGYTEIRNLKGYKAEACWEISFNNGKTSSGCRTLGPYEEGSASCFNCAPKNSGVRTIDAIKYERK